MGLKARVGNVLTGEQEQQAAQSRDYQLQSEARYEQMNELYDLLDKGGQSKTYSDLKYANEYLRSERDDYRERAWAAENELEKMQRKSPS